MKNSIKKVSLVKYIDVTFSPYTQWCEYAIKTLPYLIDCAQKKETITYSELGNLLYKAGITEKLYANSIAATYVGRILGIIGEYCINNSYPPLNALVVRKENLIVGRGAHCFIKKYYKIKKVTHVILNTLVYPKIFAYNWANFCKINNIDSQNLFWQTGLLIPKDEDFTALEYKYIYKHLRNESIGRIGADKIRKIKQIKGHQCEVCGFDFSKHYKNIGKDFIELHHLPMYKNMKNHSIRRLNIKDFACLCSNCHSMIHKLPHPQNNKEDIIQLKKLYNSNGML